MKKHSKPPKRDRLFVKVWEGVVPEREYSFFFCVREKFWVEAGRERCLILKKKWIIVPIARAFHYFCLQRNPIGICFLFI